MFVSSFYARIMNASFLWTGDVNSVSAHLKDDLFSFGWMLHTPNTETAYPDFSCVWNFHRCYSFLYWFVRDVRISDEFPNVGIGVSVAIVPGCLKCFASPWKALSCRVRCNWLAACWTIARRSGLGVALFIFILTHILFLFVFHLVSFVCVNLFPGFWCLFCYFVV